MFSLIATLVTIAFVAIPIAIVVTIVRRLARVSQRLRDPTRLQQAVAKLEVIGMGAPHARARPPTNRLGGLDMGDSFRLSEPPDQGEPHARVAISNWFAVALFAGAAAYYFLR